tara:strand:+ start:697 stop:927 length:231 start_codon:yes stop_codon:yes gene_type:complete
MEIMQPVVVELLQQVLLVVEVVEQVEQEYQMIFQEVQYLMLEEVEVQLLDHHLLELEEQVPLVEQVVELEVQQVLE